MIVHSPSQVLEFRSVSRTKHNYDCRIDLNNLRRRFKLALSKQYFIIVFAPILSVFCSFDKIIFEND